MKIFTKKQQHKFEQAKKYFQKAATLLEDLEEEFEAKMEGFDTEMDGLEEVMCDEDNSLTCRRNASARLEKFHAAWENTSDIHGDVIGAAGDANSGWKYCDRGILFIKKSEGRS